LLIAVSLAEGKDGGGEGGRRLWQYSAEAMQWLARLCWMSTDVTRIALARGARRTDHECWSWEGVKMRTLPGWGLLAMLLATSAAAQTQVYKCTDGGRALYQQTPCQGQAEWRWEVPAEQSLPRGSAPLTAEAAPTGNGGRRPTRRSGRAQGALIPISADAAACARARRMRTEALARTRRADFVQRRQWDDAVFEACR
jgi:hypothetical protein